MTVWITLYVEGSGRYTVSQLPQTVPAVGRLTIHMNTFLAQVEASEGLPPGTLQGKSFSFKVTVVAGSPISPKRPSTGAADGSNFWRSGSAAFGIPQ